MFYQYYSFIRFSDCFLDYFAKQIKQNTVVVLDNAPIRHPDEFQEQIAVWEEKDLYIFFLPAHSPHPNRAGFRINERLWLKAKYEWVKQSHIIMSLSKYYLRR